MKRLVYIIFALVLGVFSASAQTAVSDTVYVVMNNLVVTPSEDGSELLEASNSELDLTISLGVSEEGLLIEGSTIWINTSELPIIEGNVSKSYSLKEGTVSYVGYFIVDNNGIYTELQLVMCSQPDVRALYFHPGVWAGSDATFFVYSTNSVEGTNTSSQMMMLEDGLYYAQIPTTHTHVIFVRMPSTATELDWSTKWNQSEESTINGNYYTITDWTSGEWSTYNPLATAPVENQCGDNLYWELVDSTLTIDGSGVMYDYDYENPAPWYGVKNQISIVNLSEKLSSIGDYAFASCSNLKYIYLPNQLDSIGDGAFSSCIALNNIIIPANVSRIKWAPFYNCPELSSITVESANSVYDSRNNCNAIIETATNTLIAGCHATVIPNDVVCIGSYAFMECSSLFAITIPSSVNNIKGAAFADCSSLKTVYVEATTPPVLEYSDVFTSQPTCYIPVGTLAAYQESSWASQVGSFVEQEEVILTCVEAVEMCTSTTPTSETYTIRGYVTQIVYEYSSSYNNITFWMADEVDGGQVLMAYRVQPVSTTDQAVKVGDYVEVVGSLQLYSTIPEVAQGGSYTILNASPSPENKCGDNLYWTLQDSTLIITGSGAMYDYYSSENIPWNDLRSSIKNVSLPNGMTSIAFSSFYYCINLRSITIPNSVTNINTNNPFNFCPSLISIEVMSGNTTYDSREGCNAIIETATNTLIIGCQNTTIPQSVTSIGERAFEGCSNLNSINIHKNILSIGIHSFGNCYAVTSIIVEDGNAVYDSREGCNAIIETATNTLMVGCQTTVIPSTITTIGDYAFSNRSTSNNPIVIPNGVTTINEGAFWCCSFESITIPESVTSIGRQAFAYSSSLTSVYVKSITPPTLGSSVFTSKPTCYIPAGTLAAYQASDWAQYVGSFVEQGSTTTPTSNYHNFEDASLNAEWQFIQDGQTNYWTIGTAAGSASTGSNALYITNDGSNYAYTVGSSSVSWAYIPISITENDSLSFYWKGIAESCCDYLYVYLMPIGSLPTAGSTTLPEGTITLTNKLNQISEWQSFSTTGYTGDYNLCFMWRNDESVGETPVAVDNVSIGENTPPASTTGQCGDNLFWEYNNGTLTITGTGAMYDFSDDEVPWKDFRGTITTVSLPQGLTTIGTYAFAHCRVLSSITLPNTVTIIGDYAFYDCDALINMVIPESVTTIGNNAFLYCDGLTNVTLPSGITAVEDNAFASCPSLTTITIPNGVTTIGNYAFYDCDALTTVNMPNTLITIGNYAFANCDVLSGITIPNSVTTIGNNAFYSCSALTAIHVEATTPPTIGSNLFSSAPTCYIPCGTLAVYQASDWASQVGSFVEEDCGDSAMITYELNGGVTNDYGWMTKNDMFQACMADAGVTGLASLDELKAAGDASFTTICAGLDVTRCQYILDNEKWDWLEAYIMNVQNNTANATALTEGSSSAGWRYALAAFFLETKRTSWPVSADFSQAGTVQAFMPAWQHGFVNPTAPTTSFVLNAPYKEGYTFGGWYTNATFSGSNITTVNASTTGTLYAKWIEGTAIPTTNAHICYGESYTWEVNGMTYTESGTYTSYADEWGMATAILNLTVAPAPIIEADSVVITENELPYIWRGYSIAEAGNYVMTEQSIHGCDSILYELYLTVEASGTSGLTYNVTVPAGTSDCYIAGDMNGWTFTEMTKVNNTHFTITIEGATTDMTYKYCSGPAWDYVEKDAYGSEISARTYSTNDVVESWANIYQPLPTTPASDYHNFEDASLNTEWQFVQDGQTNYWTIGTAAGSTSDGSNALYITNDGYNYSYNNSTVSVSWAYIPVELVSTDTISFNWKGAGETGYDNMCVYLYPTGTLPTAGSAPANDAVQVTSSYLCGQSDWQTYAAVPGMDGTFNLCFMWKNDNSMGSEPIAVDEVRIAHFAAPANPENQCGDNLYWTYSNGTLTITGSGAMYDGNDLLTYHQQSWFPDEVTRVNLPNGMTHIGATAFADCSNLTSINIPSSVVSIGEAAFAWSGLQTLTLPEGVQDIDDMVFANCSNLTKFIYRGTLYGLDNATTPMFLGCNQLDTIIAPARMWDCPEPDASVQEYYGFPSHIRYIEVTGGELSATNISYMANSSRTLLTLDISSVSNTTLPDYAFANWTGLETLRLPVNLTAIPVRMAYACESLKAISIPTYVQVIDNEAFRNCGKLSNIDFADSQNLYSIGQYAFAYCSALLSVEVPVGVQTLGAYAFRNTGLVQLRLPSTLSVIGNYTFYNCSHLLKMNVAAYTPPTVSSYTFYNVPRTAKVYVPEGAVTTYKSTAVWSEFFIYSDVQDAVDNIFTEGEEQTQKLFINGQVIIIRNGKSYNLMGQEL